MDRDRDNLISRDELVAFAEHANEAASESSLRQLFMLVNSARLDDEEGSHKGESVMTLDGLNLRIKEDDGTLPIYPLRTTIIASSSYTQNSIQGIRSTTMGSRYMA